MHHYETIFIINPDLDESETNNIIEGVKTTVESGGGKILKIDPSGKKKLAYPIKRHNDGYYVLFVFESEPDFVRQLNTYYQIIEPILKHIVVRFEGDVEKLTSASDTTASDTTKSQEDTSEEDSPGDSPLEDVESKARERR